MVEESAHPVMVEAVALGIEFLVGSVSTEVIYSVDWGGDLASIHLLIDGYPRQLVCNDLIDLDSLNSFVAFPFLGIYVPDHVKSRLGVAAHPSIVGSMERLAQRREMSDIDLLIDCIPEAVGAITEMSKIADIAPEVEVVIMFDQDVTEALSAQSYLLFYRANFSEP